MKARRNIPSIAPNALVETEAYSSSDFLFHLAASPTIYNQGLLLGAQGGRLLFKVH